MPRYPKAGALALALPAAAPAGAAEREWVLARSPAFVVVSDAGEKQARQVERGLRLARAGRAAQALTAAARGSYRPTAAPSGSRPSAPPSSTPAFAS